PFGEEQLREVAQAVEQLPAVRADIGRGQLPVELFLELQERGVFLFPSSWADLEEISCGCQDKILPCRHIAAVLVRVGAAIGRDPFLIFRLRGCDLPAIAQKIGEEVEVENQKIPQLEELFQREPAEEPPPAESPSSISFAAVPDLIRSIRSLLPPNPPFCSQNFRETLLGSLLHWKQCICPPKRSDGAISEISLSRGEVADFEVDPLDGEDVAEEGWGAEHFADRWSHFLEARSFSVLLNGRKEVIGLRDGKESIDTCDDVEELVEFLNEVPEDVRTGLCEELQFISILLKFTYGLVGRSALVPQLLRNGRDEVFVRWIPALFNGEVRNIFAALAARCPERLFLFRGNPLPPEEQVRSAVDMFFQQRRSLSRPNVLRLLKNEELADIFFRGKVLSPLGRQLDVGAVRDWLAPLHATGGNCYPRVLVEERGTGNFVLSVALSLAEDPRPVPLAEALQQAKDENSIFSALAPIVGQIPEMAPIRDGQWEIPVPLERFGEIFFDAFPRLRAMGIGVVLPDSLAELENPKLRLSIEMEEFAGSSESLRGMPAPLRFDWTVAIGDRRLSAGEFRELADGAGTVVSFGDKYLAGEEVRALRRQLEKLPKKISQGALFQAALAEDMEGASVDLGRRICSFLDQMRHCGPVRPPDNLRGTLRPYQIRGFGWLLQNVQLGFGSILADDMGLGKTLQVIALVLHLKNEGAVGPGSPVLVIAPTGLLSNWRKEFEKFAPSVRTAIYHGPERGAFPANCDVLITSYGCNRSDRALLGERDWFLVAIDEAQNIKNTTAQRTRAVKALRTEHRIALSGTPVENRLQEYWSIFDFTNCGYLGGAKQFEAKFARPIERYGDRSRLELFQRITAPFILRRLKSDGAVLADLPPKMESDVYCSLTAEQVAIYNRTVGEFMGKIEGSTEIGRRGKILALISALKQICNHPAQFQGSSHCEVSQSGKMQLLEEILEEIWESGDGKSLIFTQYVHMGQIIGQLMGKKFRMEIPFLHGGLRLKERDGMVERFQSDPAEKILIVSLRAGGTGLNLTAANNVIHYDLWWNPAVETQATDRAHRIGQRRAVTVRRLISEGTLEERIDEMIRAKKDLANLAIGSGESWITEMSNEDIRRLVTLSRGSD
ncbi:MAG: DEAD/DEAH box helicase family protein, partial [Puniceicoccales bacterium]|nr:DEAD/DEAH box helicase family protein [Puniceicoccales bacterium]